MGAYVQQLDSHTLVSGRLLDVIDLAWASDRLPSEEIAVPVEELPDTEPDSGTGSLTLRQLESRWTDLCLNHPVFSSASVSLRRNNNAPV